MDDLMEGFAELYRVTWLVGLLVGLLTWLASYLARDLNPSPAQ